MRSKLFAGLVVLLAVAAAGMWWRARNPSPQAAGPTAAARPAAPAATGGEPLQRRLYLDIQHNGLTTEKARRLFSLVFGDLPGVTTKEDDRDPDDFCGTTAVGYIHAVWRSLTDTDRAAVRKALTPPSSQRVGRMFAPLLPGTSGEPHVMLAGFTSGGGTGKYDYLQMAKDADFAIAKRLNRLPVKFTMDVTPNMPGNGKAKAETDSWDEQLIPREDGCHILVFDPMFAKYTTDAALSIMSHEMWHCYQQDKMIEDPDKWISAHGWIREGEADWTMATIWPAGTAYANDWNAYVTTPAKPFVDRYQDGLGIFGHLADVMGSDAGVWQRMLDALPASGGGEDMAPFLQLTQGFRLPYVTSWGSSFFLDGAHDNWSMKGPGTVPQAGIAPDYIFIPSGGGQPLDSVGWFQAKMLRLSSDADVLSVGLLTGYGRLHDEGYGLDTQMVSGDVVVMCLKSGGCACPDGSPGASMIAKRAKGPIYVGIEGADGTAQAAAAGASLDDFCKQPDPPDPPKPPQPPGGGGPGGGDPDNPQPPPDGGSHDHDVHIRTFDGLRYDFQVIGEYTLVKSTVDDFVVQVREVPAMHSRNVSVSQATATKIGNKRVTITLEDAHPVLRIDGTIVTDARVAVGGGTIERATSVYGDAYRIEWPDGTTARVDQTGARMLNTKIKPAESRRGKLVGLMGNDNGTAFDDLMANGASLGLHPSPDDVVHKLADAWRLTPDASLFDYAAGQSMATFTDPAFPEENIDPMKVPDRATAEQRCRQEGITDRQLLDNCIVDYGMTNDFLFASSYRREQQVLAARAALPPPTPGIRRTVMMAGTITTPASQASRGFAAAKGDVLWIGYPDCTDNYMQGTLLTPSGKRIGGGAICARGRLVLPETGAYQLISYRTDNPVGAYSIPLRIVRPDRVATTAYGSVVAGRIEASGVHDIYTFEGHEGDVLRISGEGCDLGPMVVSVIDPAGHDALGPNCRAGADYLVRQSGTFKLLINGGDSGSGPYHFVFQGAPGSAGK